MVVERRHWTEYVRDVSERAEFQTATIQIRNPRLLTRTQDIKTGVVTVTGDPVVWSGQARIVGYRAAVPYDKGSLSNPTGIKAMRFQIPHDSYEGRVERGWQIRVTDAPHNPLILSYLFTVTADTVVSNEASRTIEANVDVETVPGWE